MRLVASNEWAGFRWVARKLLSGAAAAGTVVAIGVIAVTAAFVPAVWGAAYGTSTPVLERTLAATMAGARVLNVAPSAALLPVRGAVDAACATVVGESLLAAALLTLVVRQARRSRRAEPGPVRAA